MVGISMLIAPIRVPLSPVRSEKTSFLKSPVGKCKIVSKYNLKRFHPILQTWRAHLGVDYAAPTGTAVRSAKMILQAPLARSH